MGRYGEIAEAVGKGVVSAWKTYGSWSDNFYVHDEGIEAFLSVKIAESLYSTFSDICWVRLEVPFSQLVECAGLEGDARHHGLSPNEKVDVAFYDKKHRLIGVVEVERHFMPAKLRGDVVRVCSLLNALGSGNGGSMRWGVVTAMHTIWAANNKSTEQRLESAVSALSDSVSGRMMQAVATTKLLKEPPRGHEDLRGCSGMCLMFS